MPLAICRQCDTRFVVDRKDPLDAFHCPHCGGEVRWVIWPTVKPEPLERHEARPAAPLIAVPLRPDGKPN